MCRCSMQRAILRKQDRLDPSMLYYGLGMHAHACASTYWRSRAVAISLQGTASQQRTGNGAATSPASRCKPRRRACRASAAGAPRWAAAPARWTLARSDGTTRAAACASEGHATWFAAGFAAVAGDPLKGEPRNDSWAMDAYDCLLGPTERLQSCATGDLAGRSESPASARGSRERMEGIYDNVSPRCRALCDSCIASNGPLRVRGRILQQIDQHVRPRSPADPPERRCLRRRTAVPTVGTPKHPYLARYS